MKKEQEIAGTETPVLISKPFEVHQALIPKNRNLLKKSTDKKLKSSAIDGLVNPSPYTYGTFPPESHLQVKGHSRGNFSVKWVKKTKQYLEIASAAWDKNERLKSKGVLADDFMDLSTKARYISFGQKKLRMPLVLSNKGYAIGVAAGSTVLFCNVRTYGQYIYTQGTGQIDYYFIYDENQERNIEQYRNLQV